MNLYELESLLRDSKRGVVPILAERILAMIDHARAISTDILEIRIGQKP